MVKRFLYGWLRTKFDGVLSTGRQDVVWVHGSQKLWRCNSKVSVLSLFRPGKIYSAWTNTTFNRHHIMAFKKCFIVEKWKSWFKASLHIQIISGSLCKVYCVQIPGLLVASLFLCLQKKSSSICKASFKLSGEDTRLSRIHEDSLFIGAFLELSCWRHHLESASIIAA